MGARLTDKLEDLSNSFQRLSSRERGMLVGLGGAVVISAVLMVGYLVVSGLEEIEAENDAMRQALLDLSQKRECYLAHRQRLGMLEVRMAHPLELNRFVETAASAVGVSIAESSETQPVTLDRYTQRGVEIRLRKVSLGQLARLMHQLEASQNIVQITKLSVTTRWNQHSELDVEMVVSTYQRRDEKKRKKKKGTKRSRRRRGRG